MREEERLERILERLDGPSLLLCGPSVSFIQERVEEVINALEKGRRVDFDVIEVSPSGGNIGIDEVRKVSEFLMDPPVYASRRYAMIMDADRFTLQAANAFLKVLEEHRPEDVVLLLSQRCDELLETIKSRCFRLDFGYPLKRVRALIERRKELKTFITLMLEDYGILRFLEDRSKSPNGVDELMDDCDRYAALDDDNLVGSVVELLEESSPKKRILFHCWFKEILKRLAAVSERANAEMISKLATFRDKRLSALLATEAVYALREFALVFGSSAWHLTKNPDILKEAALLPHEIALDTVIEELHWFLDVVSRKAENLNDEITVFVALLRLKRLLKFQGKGGVEKAAT